MSTPTTVYMPVPVSERPDKEDYYAYASTVDSFGTAYWTGKEWRYYRHVPDNSVEKNIKSWLKPIQISSDSPVQKVIDFFKHDPEAIGRWNTSDIVEMLKPFLPADLARTARIQQLEMQVDHLEEGCNERDKQIKELEAELKNHKHLNID